MTDSRAGKIVFGSSDPLTNIELQLRRLEEDRRESWKTVFVTPDMEESFYSAVVRYEAATGKKPERIAVSAAIYNLLTLDLTKKYGQMVSLGHGFVRPEEIFNIPVFVSPCLKERDASGVILGVIVETFEKWISPLHEELRIIRPTKEGQ